MKKSHLAILAAVAGIAVIGGYIASTLGPARPSTPSPTGPNSPDGAGAYRSSGVGPLLSGLKDRAKDVTRVTVRSSTATVDLAKSADGAGWLIASKANYPADGNAVRELLGALANAEVLEEKTSKPDLYARIGVDDVEKPGSKSVRVSLFDASGASLGSVLIGNTQAEQAAASQDRGSGPVGPRRFVRREGQGQSFLASLATDARAESTAWAESKILEIPSERVKSASFSVPAGAASGDDAGAAVVTSMSRGSSTQTAYAVAGLPTGRALKDQYVAGRAAQMLSYLTFEDVRPASEVTFDGPGVATATFTMFDGLVLTVKTADEGGEVWHHVAATYEPPPEPTVAAPSIEPPSPAANAEASLDAPSELPVADPSAVTPEEQATNEAAAAALRAEREKLESEAAALNAALGPWAFRVQEFKAKQLRTMMEDLLAPAAEPTTIPSDPPSAPALNPIAPDGSGSLLVPPQ